MLNPNINVFNTKSLLLFFGSGMMGEASSLKPQASSLKPQASRVDRAPSGAVLTLRHSAGLSGKTLNICDKSFLLTAH